MLFFIKFVVRQIKVKTHKEAKMLKLIKLKLRKKWEKELSSIDSRSSEIVEENAVIRAQNNPSLAKGLKHNCMLLGYLSQRRLRLIKYLKYA